MTRTFETNSLRLATFNVTLISDGWSWLRKDYYYDADGRATVSAENDGSTWQTYDARGLLTRTVGQDQPGDTDIERFYTGDGREGKRKKKVFVSDPQSQTYPYGNWVAEPDAYYIRSSVLGGAVVSETTATGAKKKTNIYAAGAKLATQSEYTYNSTPTEAVLRHHETRYSPPYTGIEKGG